MPAEWHIFRDLAEDTCDNNDGVFVVSHHSGGCWCRYDADADFIVPRHSNTDQPGVRYFMQKVSTDSWSLFCGDGRRDMVRHLYFAADGRWNHAPGCWCAQRTDYIVGMSYPLLLKLPSSLSYRLICDGSQPIVAYPPERAAPGDYHVLRASVAGDDNWRDGITETHSSSCWCQYDRQRDWGVPASEGRYIRRVAPEEQSSIAGRAFRANYRHVYVVDDDGEHFHAPNCWCSFSFNDRRTPRDLYGHGILHAVETSEEADSSNIRLREEQDEIEEEYGDDEEEPPLRVHDPIRAMQDRPARPGGMRHLFYPDGEYLRHTSSCWCQMAEGRDLNWRALDQGRRDIVLDVWEDEIGAFIGRPIDAHAPTQIHFFAVRQDGTLGDHHQSCWCRLQVPVEGLYVRTLSNLRIGFKTARRSGYGELGVQGERFCFNCGWQARDHQLRRTKKGFKLVCPKEKNPDMRFLNLNPPAVTGDDIG